MVLRKKKDLYCPSIIMRSNECVCVHSMVERDEWEMKNCQKIEIKDKYVEVMMIDTQMGRTGIHCEENKRSFTSFIYIKENTQRVKH